MKPISDNDRINAEMGKTFLFVYGDITYDDLFDVHHKTEYCFQLYGKTMKPDGKLDRYMFYQGPLHNCADNDCRDGK